MKEDLNFNIGAEIDANNQKLRKKKFLIYLSKFFLLLILLIVIILIINLNSKPKDEKEKEKKDDSEEGEEEAKWNWVPKWDKLKTR